MMRHALILLSITAVGCSSAADSGSGEAPAAWSATEPVSGDDASAAAVTDDAEDSPTAPREERPEAQPPDEDPPDSPEPADRHELSVMTFNLWNAYINRDRHEQRTALVASEISRLQPDLVALQENVSSADIEDRALVLAALTGYEVVTENTHEVPFAFEEGIAVLSRLPVQEVEVLELPHRDLSVVQRKALIVTVATSAGPATLLATHMMVDADQAKKSDQARALADAGRSFPHPTFIAGDLNAEPESEAMGLLRGEVDTDGPPSRFVDAWIRARVDEPGYTHPSEAPRKRIDYIYFAEGQDRAVDVVQCWTVLGDEADGLRASDHVGVLCSFEL